MTLKVSASLKCLGHIHAFRRALWLMQAIALIVAHRTDDMSKLPPVITTEVVKKAKQAAGRAQQSSKITCAHRMLSDHQGK